MARSQKKGPFVDEKLFRKVMNLKSQGSTVPIRTWARRSTIVPEFIGHKFEVHNGKMFHSVYVTEDMGLHTDRVSFSCLRFPIEKRPLFVIC